MWVVKLGGSLVRNRQLRPWIQALTGAGKSDGPALAVVPGGGPFADRVREMQASLGFDESTAHKMAVLAMEQYGMMLAELCPRLVPVSSKASMLRAARKGKIPLWMPSRMVFAQGNIPGLWEVTSDSLAAWLAGHLGAQCLILVKSVDPVFPTLPNNEQAAVPLSALQERGVIDRAFAKFAGDSEVAVHCVGPADRAEFANALERGRPPGVKVDVTG